MLQTLSLAAQVVFFSLFGVYLLALTRKEDSLATVFFGPVLVAATAAVYFVDGSFTPRQILVLLLVAFWGTRLGVHLFLKDSDRTLSWQAAKWQRKWLEGFFIQGFVKVVVFQGLTAVAMLTPVLLIMSDPSAPLTRLDAAGAAIWALGFVLEAVADNELLAWRKVPGHEGHLVTTGLWRLSRHPNYFGEILVWWGIFLVGLATRGGWWGIVSPLVVSALVLFVTGVPKAEKKYHDHPEWKVYADRTSILVPWFPRPRPTRPPSPGKAP